MTMTVHIKDSSGTRSYAMGNHADGGMEPVAFLRARADGYFRSTARSDFRASVTDGQGRIVARAWIRDVANRLRVEAW